jgi:hypothetical protein
MNTTIENRDLTKQAPHSPRDRFGGFAIIARTTDKCRASVVGKLGEYHFDCPLDNQLFNFKGINAAQFKKAVTSAKTYDEVAEWLQKNGTPRSEEEIKQWSDKMDAVKLRDIPTMKEPEHRKEVSESCQKLGLDFETAGLFEWLEADDQASYQQQPELATK